MCTVLKLRYNYFIAFKTQLKIRRALLVIKIKVPVLCSLELMKENDAMADLASDALNSLAVFY
jgi:hypothetical protein